MQCRPPLRSRELSDLPSIPYALAEAAARGPTQIEEILADAAIKRAKAAIRERNDAALKSMGRGVSEGRPKETRAVFSSKTASMDP